MAFGAVHKVRHAIFDQFGPPSPSCHILSHIPEPPKVRHPSRPPPIFSRLSTKNPDKSPLYTISLNCSKGIFSGAFVKGSFVWKVLSVVVLVHSPFCQNTSAPTES